MKGAVTIKKSAKKFKGIFLFNILTERSQIILTVATNLQLF